VTLSFEMQDVVFGICKYQGQQTVLNNRMYSGLKYQNLKIKIHRIIFLLVALYGCETWSVTLRE